MVIEVEGFARCGSGRVGTIVAWLLPLYINS